MGQAAVPLIMMALAAGGEYYNTEKTASRQDQAAADAIRNQGNIQKEGDAKVSDTVAKLADSTAAAAKEQRLTDYLQVLRRNKDTTTAGLTPTIGSDAFRADANAAAGDAQNYAQQTAGLMARMDAPGIQRQQEGFDYGRLGTDLGLIGRESQGQAFLDQLRQRGIRRNAKIDLASGLLMAGAGAMGGAGGTGANGTSYYSRMGGNGAGDGGFGMMLGNYGH